MWSDHNLYYGHEGTLQRYCNYYLPIDGKIQHGYVVTPDGFAKDKYFKDFTYLVWNSRIANMLTVMGSNKVKIIGAPYLYLGEDPVPRKLPNSLLAIPTHSLDRKRLKASLWNEYLDYLDVEKRRYETITVLLHPIDYYNEETARLFISRGYFAVSCSESLENYKKHRGNEPEFLYRLRLFIRMHSMVSSNRLCTAIFYSLLEDTPIAITRPQMHTEPRDFHDDLTDDFSWIEKNFPGIYDGGGFGKEEALKELGAEYKQGPEVLKKTLWHNTF